MAARIVNGQVVWDTPSSRLVSVKSKNAGPTPGQLLARQDMERAEAQKKAAQLQAQWQSEQASANAANQQRYDQLIGSVTGLQGSVGGIFDQMQGLMEGMGATGAARIADAETQNLASSEQDLISRGLGNTTIRETARRGIKSDAERARQDLDERVALSKAGVLGQRAGAEMNLGQLMADSILSRQDVGPQSDLYTQLMMQLFNI